MDNNINVGVIGCGNISGYHLSGFSDVDLFNLKAVVDLVSEKAEDKSKNFDVPICETDYNKVLDRSDVDVVAILTPYDTHYDLVMDSIDAGKDIFIQKPFTDTVEKAEEMIKKADENDVNIVPSFQHRFYPESIFAKKCISSGKLGEINFIRYGQSGYNSFVDVSPHGVDYIRFLTEESFIENSIVSNIVSVDELYNRGNSYVLNHKLSNNILVSHSIGFKDKIDKFSIEVVGTKGTILVRPPGSDKRIKVNLDSVSKGWFSPDIKPKDSCGRIQHMNLGKELLGKKSYSPSLSDALATVSFKEEIEKKF